MSQIQFMAQKPPGARAGRLIIRNGKGMWLAGLLIVRCQYVGKDGGRGAAEAGIKAAVK